MQSKSVPVQQMLLKQMIAEAGIVKREHKLSLKREFDKKFAQQVNLMQYHRLREDRFIESQRRVLEKQNYSIQKAREYIQLRQDKASLNKAHSIIERSKRIESDLTKWEKIVQKNKQKERARLQDSTNIISRWNDKLSESSSRKSLRMNNLSHMLHSKTVQKNEQAEQSRMVQEQERIRHLNNPQKYTSNDSRYNNSKLNSRITHRNSRISTESLFDRRNKIDEDFLEKSLLEEGQKQERINEARFMKHYMLERKQKLKHDKEEAQRIKREEQLSRFKISIQAKNEELDRKYNKKPHFRSKKNSLPLVSAHKASNDFFLNSPGEQWRGKKQAKKGKVSSPSFPTSLEESTSRALEPNYAKLVKQKIHDIAQIMRKNRG